MSLDNLNNEPLNAPADSDEDALYSAFEQVSKKESAKAKTKWSKRKWIVILTSALAVLLTAALLVLLFVPPATDPQEEKPDEQPKHDPITLLDKTEKGKTVVQKVEVKNSNDSYTLYYDQNENVFRLKGYEDITLKADLIDTLLACTGSLIATDEVKKPEALSVYGLEKPQANVTITYKDGDVSHLSIGLPFPDLRKVLPPDSFLPTARCWMKRRSRRRSWLSAAALSVLRWRITLQALALRLR